MKKKIKNRALWRQTGRPAAALTCLQVLALHVRLAVGGLGQRQWLAQHRLVLDVPHQAAAGIRRGALAHQLHVRNEHVEVRSANRTQQ